MCGLFGFCGDPKVMNATMARLVQARIKILGLYNIERGKHSCGVYMDNTILKGIEEEKLFSDFIQNNDLPIATESGNFTVIGHTRMATHGTHTYANAHPFVIKEDFVLAHNGVIKNVWDLCNKYKISHTDIQVDSIGLARLIEQEGFKILNEYQGFAALLMSRKSEPNTLYVYRGVSKRFGDKEDEERPLYYLQSTEGIYFSSLEKSLLAISDVGDKEVRQLEGSTVFKITNGKFTKVKIPIDRSVVNLGVTTNTYGGSPTANYPKPGTSSQNNTRTYTGGTTTNGQTNCSIGASHPASSQASVIANSKIVPIVWHETLPDKRLNKFNGEPCIFYQHGRFWIFTGEEIMAAHGKLLINKKGKLLIVAKDAKQQPSDNNAYYFYEGIMMRNEKCYLSAISDIVLKAVYGNFADAVSKYSMYPVCNSRSDVNTRCRNVSDYFKYRWYFNGKTVTNFGFIPIFSDRNYTISDGILKSIATQTQRGIDREACINADALKAEKEAISKTAPVVQMPPAIITPPTITAPTQAEIDFFAGKSSIKEEEIKKIVEGIKVESEIDITNFYRQWDNLEHARSTFTIEEINAMRYYVCDVMMGEMQAIPDDIFDDRVDVQLNMFLTMCIETHSSVVDLWDNANYEDILHYISVARRNPNGKIYEEKPVEETSDEVCEFVPKPVNNEYKPIVSEIPFPHDLEEPSIAETLAQQEQACVPNGDLSESEDEEIYVEEIEEETERDYAFMEIIDGLGEMRDAAVELTTHGDDDFAQEVASAVFRTVDPLIYRLRDLSQSYGERELENYADDNIKRRVEI